MALALLPWNYATGIAAVSCAVGLGLARVNNQRARGLGAFLRETALMFSLYAMWQLGARLSFAATDGAMDRARAISRFQELLWLPSEASVQQIVLPYPTVVKAANLYYGGVHFPLMLIFLLWLFFRYREHYRPVRRVLATTTLICLVVQFIPVAPPRMLPGIVDTGRLYGQSVYHSTIGAAQLAAMPSVHVAWAVMIGYFTWRIARSNWRILGPCNAVMTVIVVVITGNHWWLDAIAAVAAFALALWLVRLAEDVVARWRNARSAASAALEPATGAAAA